MKNQALFSLKDKSKKLKCRLLQFLFCALRVKLHDLIIIEYRCSVNFEPFFSKITGGQYRFSIPQYNLSVILYTKYELSILHSCGDIFDEKCGEKEKKEIYREE